MREDTFVFNRPYWNVNWFVGKDVAEILGSLIVHIGM